METNGTTGLEDPAYRAAVVDLLGVLAYGELTACIRMATDADLAPSLRIKAQMAGFAAAVRGGAVRAGQASAAKRSMSALAPDTMMRSWFDTTVSAVA